MIGRSTEAGNCFGLTICRFFPENRFPKKSESGAGRFLPVAPDPVQVLHSHEYNREKKETSYVFTDFISKDDSNSMQFTWPPDFVV